MADPVFVDDVTPLNAVNMNKLQTRDEKAAANGYPSLGADGKVPAGQLPAPVVPGATLTYRGAWVAGTYVDGDVAVLNGIAYLCVGGPTVVSPDPTVWDDTAAPVGTTPWVPLWSLTPAPAGGASVTPVSLTVPTGTAYWMVTALGVTQAPHYELPDAATTTIYGYVLVPPGVTAGTLRAVLAANATTGNVRMAGYVASAQAGETLAPGAWDILNGGLATVAMAGTAWFRRDLTFSLTGLTGGDTLSIGIQRIGADALDTMAAALCLFGAWLEPA